MFLTLPLYMNIITMISKSCGQIKAMREKKIKIFVQQNQEREMSRVEIEDDFVEARPTWREELIKVPSTLVPHFEKHFPANHTEKDLSEYLTEVFNEVVQSRVSLLKDKEQLVEMTMTKVSDCNAFNFI